MIRHFDRERTRDMRALQVWLVLIARASERKTITYEELQKILGYKGAGVFAQTLGHILYYCQEEGLPSLTSIVVKKRKGRPGSGFTRHIQNVDVEQEKVFQCNWFGIVPPTGSDLKSAFERKAVQA